MSFVVAGPPCSQDKSIVTLAPYWPCLTFHVFVMFNAVPCCAMWQGSTLEYRFEPALIVCNGPAGQVTVFESSEVGEEAFVMRR